MFDNSAFQKLIDDGQPTGEVIAVDRFLVTVKGLDGVAVNATVLFESGQHGMVREVMNESVLILQLDSEQTPLGSMVALQGNIPTVPVGEKLIGRVMTPLGQPLDDHGPLHTDATWPLFNIAPRLMERSMLSDQLPSGVSVVDMLFPVVLGQRIAVLGDSKSGKTTFLLQLDVNQLRTDRIVVYVMIGKRNIEVNQVIRTLNETGAINHSVVVVADVFSSLAQSYIAPYVGCSIAEYLWHQGRDVVVIYDDLSAHAKVYREISLLAQANPGRDSYPGDMFHAHSSLLERAGKLAQSGKTLTALPVVLTPGDDVTAYLPTSIMSITDGQLIFDLATFRQNVKPAVNTGLSVSRVGGRAQTPRQKQLSGALFKTLSNYRQAAEFAHFGSELSADSRKVLQLGQLITDACRQAPSELYSLTEQELLLATVLASAGERKLNMPLLKKQVREVAAKIKDEAEIDTVTAKLLQTTTIGDAP